MISLADNEVHIWLFSKDDLQEHYSQLRSQLSDGELLRASKFKFDKHQVGYTLFRGALRTILSLYVEYEPCALQFEYTDKGKPFLPGAEVQFNLSHSGDYALIAVTRNVAVGADIEQENKKRDMLPIAERFFAANEYQAILSQPESEQQAFAHELWCLKEAFLKATGEGVVYGLERFEVAIDAKGAKLAFIDDDNINTKEWVLLPLTVLEDYHAAIAVNRCEIVTKHHEITKYLK